VRSSFLYKNKLLFSEDPNFVTVEDYDFWLNLARLGARFHFIPHIKGEYVIHASNSSSQQQRHHNNFIKLVKKHTFELQAFDTNKQRLWKKVVVKVEITELKHALSNKDYFVSLKKLLDLIIFNSVNSVSFLLYKFKKYYTQLTYYKFSAK
jgi:GT2 family glycosyltransferase